MPSRQGSDLTHLEKYITVTPVKMVSPLHFRLFAVSGSQGTRRGSPGLVFTRPPARQGDILPESGGSWGDYLRLHMLYIFYSSLKAYTTIYCAHLSFIDIYQPLTDSGIPIYKEEDF